MSDKNEKHRAAKARLLNANRGKLVDTSGNVLVSDNGSNTTSTPLPRTIADYPRHDKCIGLCLDNPSDIGGCNMAIEELLYVQLEAVGVYIPLPDSTGTLPTEFRERMQEKMEVLWIAEPAGWKSKWPSAYLYDGEIILLITVKDNESKATASLH